MRGSRGISLVPSLHRASTDALIVSMCKSNPVHVAGLTSYAHFSCLHFPFQGEDHSQAYQNFPTLSDLLCSFCKAGVVAGH